MDLEAELKVSRLLREQAEKLSEALEALRHIRSLPCSATVLDAKTIATGALKEIANYGKDSEGL